MRARLKWAALYFAAGVAGVIVTVLALHAWNDHLAFHQLVEFINAHAAKIQKLP